MGGDSGSGGGDSGGGGDNFVDTGLGVPSEAVIADIVTPGVGGFWGDVGSGDDWAPAPTTGSAPITPVYVNAPNMYPGVGQTVASVQRASEASVIGKIPTGSMSFGPSDLISKAIVNTVFGGAPFLLSSAANIGIGAGLKHAGVDKALGGPFFTLEGNPVRLDVKANLPGGEQYTVVPSLIGSLERGQTLREGIQRLEKSEARLEDMPFVQGEGGEFRDRVSKVGEPLVRADAKDARFGLDPKYSSVDPGDYGLPHELDAMPPRAGSQGGMGEGDIVSSEAQIQSMIEEAKLEASQEDGFTQEELDNFLDLPLAEDQRRQELKVAADLSVIKGIVNQEVDRTIKGFSDLGSLMRKTIGGVAESAGGVVTDAIARPLAEGMKGGVSLLEGAVKGSPNLVDAMVKDAKQGFSDFVQLIEGITSPSDRLIDKPPPEARADEMASVGWAPENLNEGNEPPPKKSKPTPRVAGLRSGKPAGRKLSEDETARQRYRGRLYGTSGSLFSKKGGSRTGFG